MPKVKTALPKAITDIANLIKKLERAFSDEFSEPKKDTYRTEKIVPSVEHKDFEIFMDQITARDEHKRTTTGMKAAGEFLNEAARSRLINGRYFYKARTEKEGPYWGESTTSAYLAEEYYHTIYVDTLTAQVRPGDLKGLEKIIPPKIHELNKISAAKHFLAAVKVDKINEVLGLQPDLLQRGIKDLSKEAETALEIGRGTIVHIGLRDYINDIFAKVDKDTILSPDVRAPLYVEIMGRFVDNRKLQPVINELALGVH